jgi:hypothetical protein
MGTVQQPMPWPPPLSARERFETQEGKDTWDGFMVELAKAIADKNIGFVADAAESRDHPRRHVDERVYAQLLKALCETQQFESNLTQYRERTIREARRAGAPWSRIADALGVTRQSAWERYRHVDVLSPGQLAQYEGRWPTAEPDDRSHAQVLAEGSKKWGEEIVKAFNLPVDIECLITGKHLELVEGKCPRCGKYDLED